jgi:hypothetical protein
MPISRCKVEHDAVLASTPTPPVQRFAVRLIKGTPKSRLSSLGWLDLYDRGTKVSQYPPGGLSKMAGQVHGDNVSQYA